MRIGIPRERARGESRVAATPDTVKRYVAQGYEVVVEQDAGTAAGIADAEFESQGASTTDTAGALGADVVLKVIAPDNQEIAELRQGALLASFIDVCGDTSNLQQLAAQGVSAIAMELIPRISRAQTMDALSSQAGVAGYRAVIEAAHRYGRFLPLMMTAAGSVKAARVIVLGAGVAGLQAIATARRLGAGVFAYDVRPQVREEIESLGAKFLDLDIGESGEGSGGYARELSEQAKQRQVEALNEELKKADIIITTAQIPCRPAPTLITEDAVRGMRRGSVIVDLAAATGGNCPLTKSGEVIEVHGVTICGLTNLPSLMAHDASSFYARNLMNLVLSVTEKDDDGAVRLKDLTSDEVTSASLVTHAGEVRYSRPN